MDTTVPQHIQQRMEDAQKLQQALYGEKEAPVPDTANTPAEPVEPAVAEVAPEAVIEPKVEPVAEPQPQPRDDFEHQYKVIKGKYDAEVPRLQHQNRELERQMRELYTRLEEVERKREEPPKADDIELVSAKDVEDFGADLMDAVRRVATQVAKAELASLEARIAADKAATETKLAHVQERVVLSESEKFWNRVETLVPDWKSVDIDPEWISFLNTSPDFTTETYRELAGKAIAAGEAEKVAKLVAIWRGTKPVEPAPEPTPKQPHPDLQRQVAPSTAKSFTPPASPKIWTGAEYEAIYSPQAVTKYPAKELEALQAELQVALAEGRVRW